jgi:hypothetical protein
MYIAYQDDPTTQRYSVAFGDICDNNPTKQVLKLVDRCFTIFNKAQTLAQFCQLTGWIYPVDSYQLINYEVCAGETLSVFDNSLDTIPPYSGQVTVPNYPLGTDGEFIQADSNGNYYILQIDKNYTRGVILYIDYPQLDKNGELIIPANMNSQLSLVNRDLTSLNTQIGQFFSHFSNPDTMDANKLINRLEITNPSSTFSIKVSGLIIQVKSNTDPEDCGC